MEDNCPECGNEIYKPYKYCNACGWEKKVEEEKSESKKGSKKGKDGKKGAKKDSSKSPKGKDKDKGKGKKEKGKKGKKYGIDDELTKPLKITCKCGGVIKIKSKKRPLKFQCPDCGKSGVLKGSADAETVPDERSKKSSKIDKEKKGKSSKKEKGKKGKEGRIGKENKSEEEFDEYEDWDEDGVEGEDEFEDDVEDEDEYKLGHERRKGKSSKKARIEQSQPTKHGKHLRSAGPTRPTRHTKTTRSSRSTKPIKPGKKSVKSRAYCPQCNTKLSVTGTCPRCSYKTWEGSTKVHKTTKKGQSSKHTPPKDAHVVRPVKGRCSECNSRNLRYFDDGSGRCANCGKELQVSGGASRVQKEEYRCRSCGDVLEYVEEYERWYCYHCNEYA